MNFLFWIGIISGTILIVVGISSGVICSMSIKLRVFLINGKYYIKALSFETLGYTDRIWVKDSGEIRQGFDTIEEMSFNTKVDAFKVIRKHNELTKPSTWTRVKEDSKLVSTYEEAGKLLMEGKDDEAHLILDALKLKEKL